MWILYIRLFLLKGKSFLDYTKLFSPNEYGKNNKIFSITKKIKMKKICCVICGNYRNFKNPKISYSFEKHSFFLLFAVIV